MDVLLASDELAQELDIAARFDVAREWALGARDVAELTKHPMASRLWEFIDNRMTVAAPMPQETITYFSFGDTAHDFGYYAYLTPVLVSDGERLPPGDQRVGYAVGHYSHIPEFDALTRAIYLPNSNFGGLGKGVLLLHEALHAWIQAKKDSSQPKKQSHWVEETRVFKFEFELLENIIGSGYLRICNKIARTIKPLEEEPTSLTITYRPSNTDLALLRDKMQAVDDKEVSIWLGVCKIHAFWLYFAEKTTSPDLELASFLKDRAS